MLSEAHRILLSFIDKGGKADIKYLHKEPQPLGDGIAGSAATTRSYLTAISQSA